MSNFPNRLRLLSVGDIYQEEMSLYFESMYSTKLYSTFMGNLGRDGFLKLARAEPVSCRADIDAVKSKFKADMVLFRNWSTGVSVNYILPDEVLWSQEAYATAADGTSIGKVQYPASVKNVAYQSQPMARKHKAFWLPYCVSKYYERLACVKDIPVLLATIMPAPKSYLDMKLKSMDILVKPIVEYDPNLIHVYTRKDVVDRMKRIPYLARLIRESFHPVVMNSVIACAKIWLSPTTIWHDAGCVSHKTLQGMACGALTITNKYPGIEDVFGKDGENLLYSNEPSETLDKVKFYLAHDAEREKIAMRGYDFAHNEYGWEKHLFRLASEIRGESDREWQR